MIEFLEMDYIKCALPPLEAARQFAGEFRDALK